MGQGAATGVLRSVQATWPRRREKGEGREGKDEGRRILIKKMVIDQPLGVHPDPSGGTCPLSSSPSPLLAGSGSTVRAAQALCYLLHAHSLWTAFKILGNEAQVGKSTSYRIVFGTMRSASGVQGPRALVTRALGPGAERSLHRAGHNQRPHTLSLRPPGGERGKVVYSREVYFLSFAVWVWVSGRTSATMGLPASLATLSGQSNPMTSQRRWRSCPGASVAMGTMPSPPR